MGFAQFSYTETFRLVPFVQRMLSKHLHRRVSSARYTANLVTAAAEVRPSGHGRHVRDFVHRVQKHFKTLLALHDSVSVLA